MESGAPDHYRTLQVDPSAEIDVIQAAYRVLARRYHPDLAGDDTIMKRINAAWEVLGNKEARAAYDSRRAGSGGAASSSTPSTPAATAAPAATEPAVRTTPVDHAGPPIGRAFGTVLTYGRYEGWSLGQIALVDPAFLEWMRSVPGGRYLRPEIDAILRDVKGPFGGARFSPSAGGPTAQRMREAGVLIG